MERRALLETMGVGVGAVSLAGCLGVGSESDPETASPEEVVEQRWAAIEAEDPEAYRELYHSDSPRRSSIDDDRFPEGPFAWGEPYHREIQSRTETEATVREDVVVEGDGGLRHGFVYELRTENGQWRLWDREDLGYVYPENPEDFEECPWITRPIDVLPEEAQREVEIALEEGYYETDEELYLPHLFDLSESYLGDPTSDDVYYQASVEEDGDVSRLTLSEAIPSRGSAEFSIENRSTESLSVTLVVTRERDEEIVLEWSGEIPPEDSVTVGEFERFFGDYTAEVELGEQTATGSWDERNDKGSLTTVPIDLEETDADADGDRELLVPLEPRPSGHPPSCEQIWASGFE